MKANKIKLNGEILLDLTKDTATEADVAEGKTFHKADGTFATGTATVGGGGSMEGFHKVQFFNDDHTTLLYTVFVPHGASAMYAGDTPVSAGGGTFVGFEPSPTNVTADLDCYAVYELISTLNETSWRMISKVSAEGTSQNYFAVGDTKMIHIQGTVGTLEINGDYGVFILGFDHNKEIEGEGIHFGTFKTAAANGIEICFVDSEYSDTFDNGTKYFNMNHSGNTSVGGWAGCDMRYDILGSTDVADQDATPTCATNPVANTLMAALPADLRSVMKPMTKYTNNSGLTNDTASIITATVDYLPLLAEYERTGETIGASKYEKNKQKRYDYYVEMGYIRKYQHSKTEYEAGWWQRSPYISAQTAFTAASYGSGGATAAFRSLGLSPIFKV